MLPSLLCSGEGLLPMKLAGSDEDDRRSGVCGKWGRKESKHDEEVVNECDLATEASHSRGGAKWVGSSLGEKRGLFRVIAKGARRFELVVAKDRCRGS